MPSVPSPVKDPILVVGGGIGGLSAALAMAHRGLRVRVLERASAFTEVGAGIQLAPNAMRVFARLGLSDELRRVGVLPQRLVLADAISGRELADLPLDDFPERYGAPYLVLHRSDLLQALVDACRAAGVKLATGVDVVGVDDDGRRVTVHTSAGVDIVGAAVVAADGLHSRLRARFVQDAPVCTGFVAYRGAVPIESVGRLGQDDVVAWIAPDLHLVQYPVRAGQLYNQVAVFHSPAWDSGAAEWGTPAELDERFSVCSPRVQAAVQLLHRHVRWPMYDRPPLHAWSRGRIALLGDAAHPMVQYLAQGACQAVLDAAALADCLGDTDGQPEDIEAALDRYEQLRAEPAARVQRNAQLWGDMWHADGVARLLRDELLSIRDPHDYRHVDALYGEDTGRSAAVRDSVPAIASLR